MACFEDFAKKKDIMNNAEDEDLLIKSNKVSPNLSERPLSPILTGGLNNRKFMIGKRLSCKKSARVKLSDRFKDNNKEEYFVVKPVDVPIPVSFEDSLSASQTETLINHLDKLEELDNSRRNIYNALVRDIEASNDSFKRPISLAPNKVENIKINNVSQNVENESILQRFILDEVTPISPKKLSVGFQTAKGKNISISETDIKKCSKLFQDIIYPAQNYSEGRQNKHTFLRKNKSFKQNNSEVIANFFSNDSLKCSKPDKDIKSMQSNPLETSLTTSKLSAKLIENKHIFEGEEFGDIKFNNENLCGFKKANFQAFESTDASKETVNILDCDKDVELTLTQAICESGISNTQIISAVDNILESIEGSRKGSFIGFTKDDMTDSYERYLNLKTLLEHDHLIHGLSKKRKRSIFSVNNDHHYNTEKSEISPPCKKRLLNFENIQYKANCIENNENNFTVSRNNFGGFTSASGKSITISEKYVKSIEAIFSDIDFNIPSKKFKPDSQKNIYSESNEENSPKKAKNIFNKLDAETSNENLRNKLVAPESTSSELTESNIQRETHTDKISFDKFAIKPCIGYTNIDEEKCVPNYYNTVENPFTSCNNFMKVNFNNCAPGFCKASGKTLKISENALKKAKNLFENLSMDNSRQDSDRTLVAQTSTTSAENVKGEQNYLMNALVSGDTSISNKFSLSDELSATEVTPLNLHKPRSTSLSAKNSKKKLGMSHFKQIQICDNKLDKAKSLFDEDFSGISPIKPRQCVTYTSTPIKQNNYMASVQNDCIMPKTSFNNFVDTAGITPIKMDPVEIKQPDIPFNTKTKILCTCPSKDTWIDDLEAERKKLELKLQIFLERERLGREMLNLIKNGKSDGDKKLVCSCHIKLYINIQTWYKHGV